MLLNNTLHSGMRGRKEHVDMLFGDVNIMPTASCEQFEYSERPMTGQGDSRPFEL